MTINTNSSITETPTTNKDIKILDIRVCAGHGIGFDGNENKVIGYVNIRIYWMLWNNRIW